MRQYAGSVSFDESGGYVAVSHPHEGIVSLWAAHAVRLLAVVELADACGIARGVGAGSFLATGTHGRVVRLNAATGTSLELNRADGVYWDNHLLAL